MGKPFNLRAPDATEDEIHEAVRRFLDLALPANAFWYSVEHRNARDAIEGAKRKGRGVRAGIPDITIIYGRVHHAIELKSRTGALSAAQVAVRERLIAAGALWGLARSVEDVAGYLAVWGIPTRAGLGVESHIRMRDGDMRVRGGAV